MTNTEMMTILKVWQALPQEGFLWVYVLYLKYLHLFSPKTSPETNTQERQYMTTEKHFLLHLFQNNQAKIVQYLSTGQEYLSGITTIKSI